MAAVIKSTSYDQMEILDNIIRLHLDAPTFDVDLTYGNGRFYSGGIPMPLHRFDIDDTLDNLTESRSSSDTGLPDNTTTSCICDPPHTPPFKSLNTGCPCLIGEGRKNTLEFSTASGWCCKDGGSDLGNIEANEEGVA